MHERLRCLTVIAGLTGLLIGQGQLPASAAATSLCFTHETQATIPCPAVTSLNSSRSAVSVSGAASEAVTFTVGLRSAAGVTVGHRSGGADFPGLAVPTLILQQEARRSVSYLGLQLSGGTTYDGTWSATVNVTVADAASIVPVGVEFGLGDDLDQSSTVIPTSIRQVVTVTASHVPVLTVTPPPVVRYGARFVLSGRVRELASRAPMARVTVTVQVPNAAQQTVTTDATGVWRATVLHARSSVRVSILPPAYSDGQRPPIAQLDVLMATIDVVSAALAQSSAHVGDSIAITGSDGPGGEHTDQLVLEKWVRHTWTRVGSGAVRDGGRFTLHATPTAVGNWQYRVRDRYLGGVSTVLTLRVAA